MPEIPPFIESWMDRLDPSYDSLEGWRVELTPGDLLIIPSEWLHYVETIETSLTYSAAWIDGSNWHAYVRGAADREDESASGGPAGPVRVSR